MESVGDVFVGKLIMFTWGLKGVELSWVFHPEEEEEEEDNWNQDGIIINSLRLSGNQSVKEDLAVRLNVNGGGEEDVLLQLLKGEKRKSKGVEISIVSRRKLFKVSIWRVSIGGFSLVVKCLKAIGDESEIVNNKLLVEILSNSDWVNECSPGWIVRGWVNRGRLNGGGNNEVYFRFIKLEILFRICRRRVFIYRRRD